MTDRTPEEDDALYVRALGWMFTAIACASITSVSGLISWLVGATLRPLGYDTSTVQTAVTVVVAGAGIWRYLDPVRSWWRARLNDLLRDDRDDR